MGTKASSYPSSDYGHNTITDRTETKRKKEETEKLIPRDGYKDKLEYISSMEDPLHCGNMRALIEKKSNFYYLHPPMYP